jgi:hypothetical protein
MKNRIIEFAEAEAFKKAKEYFFKICGFQEENEKHRKMLPLAMNVRHRGLSGIRPRAVVSSYGPEIFRDRKVVLDGMEFYCPAFENVNPDCVKKIYAYMLTVGECTYRDEDDIMDQVFADIWGTAYTDSARDMLEELLKQDLNRAFSRPGQEVFLSDAFGPGFYGMPMGKTNDLFRVVEAGRIGMSVKDSGLMLPVKSCSGLYFAVTDTEGLPHPNCRDCLGTVMSCSFCKFRPEGRNAGRGKIGEKK